MKWNETGRVWEDDHGLLDEEQIAKCERADVAESRDAGTPIPTRMIINNTIASCRATHRQLRR